MVRGSSWGVGGHGFHAGPHHTKDVKNGISGYLAHGESSGLVVVHRSQNREVLGLIPTWETMFST